MRCRVSTSRRYCRAFYFTAFECEWNCLDHRENPKQPTKRVRGNAAAFDAAKEGKKGFSPTDQNVIPSNKLIKVIGNLSTTYFTAEWSSSWRTLRNVSGLTSKIPSLASAQTFHKKKTSTDVQRYLKFESCDRFLIEILLGTTNSPTLVRDASGKFFSVC